MVYVPPVASSFEHDYEPSGSKKSRNFLTSWSTASDASIPLLNGVSLPVLSLKTDIKDEQFQWADQFGRNRNSSDRYAHQNILSYLKSKAVPLHAMEVHGGRGGIAPTHT
jgi:hypothetical protein